MELAGAVNAGTLLEAVDGEWRILAGSVDTLLPIWLSKMGLNKITCQAALGHVSMRGNKECIGMVVRACGNSW